MANPIHKTKHGYYVASFASGGEFLFDEIDLPLIRAHTWHLGKRGYPATHIGGRTVVLHRLLFSDAQEYEIDHINGILFIDHISKLKRDRVIKKFTKAAKREEDDE